MTGRGNNSCTAGELQDYVVQSFKAVFKKKGGGNRDRRPAYCWNQEIAELRTSGARHTRSFGRNIDGTTGEGKRTQRC